MTGLRCSRQSGSLRWVRTSAAPSTTIRRSPSTTSAASAPAPKRGGKLVYAIHAPDPAGFTPSQTTLGSSATVIRWTMIETLTQPDPDGAIHCLLCESITPNGRYTEWTIKLRPGIAFHDGTPLDANAVKINLDDGRRPGSAVIATLRQITRVDVVDPLTVVVTVDAPWVSFPASLTQQAGAIVAPSQIRDPNGRRRPVGTGPFRFKEWVANDHITVVRNETYWRKGLPYLDEVTFRPVVEEAPRLAALSAGDVDAIGTSNGSTIAQLRRQHEAGKVRLVEYTRWPGVNVIVMNNQVPPTDDLRVRRALQLATDRAALNKVVHGGTATLADAPFGTGQLDVQGGWPKLDTAKAKALIAEVVQQTGKPVELTLTVSAGSDATAQGELLQTMWEAVGVRVKVAPNEGGNTSNIVQRGQFQVSYAGPLLSSVDPDEMRRYWYSDPAPIGTPTGNWAHVDDAIIDAAFDQIHGNSDPVVRRRAANAVVRAIAEQAYVIFTTHVQTASATSPSVAFADVVLPDGAPWYTAPTGAPVLAFAYRT